MMGLAIWYLWVALKRADYIINNSIWLQWGYMGAMASKITGGSNKEKWKSSASLPLCCGDPPVTGGFPSQSPIPSQRPVNTASVSMSWRHHVYEYTSILISIWFEIFSIFSGWEERDHHNKYVGHAGKTSNLQQIAIKATVKWTLCLTLL